MNLTLRVSAFSLLVLAQACSLGQTRATHVASSRADTLEAGRILRHLRAHYPLLFGEKRESPRQTQPTQHPALQVVIPDTATSAMRLEAAETGVAISVELHDARDVKASVAEGHVIYAGGGPDGSVLVHAPRESGTEDYLLFDHAPPGTRVIYHLTLSSHVAGLRLVANTLEVLDRHSAPRLRVNAPYLVDARGRLRSATLDVVGCAIDRSPAAPWDRAPVAPGSTRCDLQVAWDDAGLEYPLVLDPAWNVTAAMSSERSSHSGIQLANQRALIAGGWTGTGTTASAEIYDFATKTWAVTASMSSPRRNFTLTTLDLNRTIAIGGSDDAGELSSAEIYDTASAQWTSTGAMAEGRCRHTTTAISADVLLVAGGKAHRDTLASAELYSVSQGSWSSAASMLAPQAEHTATMTGSGQVLVVGPSLPAAQLFDATLNRWFPAAAPAFARRRHSATVLSQSTQVLIAGGIGRDGALLAAAEIYDAATDSWERTGSMIVGHERHSAERVPEGRVVVVGDSNPAHATSAEAYNEAWGTWAPLPDVPLTGGIFGHVALTSGNSLLIAGGLSAATGRPLQDAIELDASRTPTTVSEYKLPATVDPDVVPDTETELWAAVYRPSQLESGKRYPVLLFAHGNHSTCGPICDPSLPACCEYTWSGTCTSPLTPVLSHLGFGYIAEELASRGFIVVSTNSNRGITCGPSATDFSARSAQLLKHLQQLSEWNRGVTTTPSSLGVSLAGALDLGHVGLLGHSRGGDAVRAAYQEYMAAGSPWPQRIVDPVTFRGIFEIAPTDDQPTIGATDNVQWNALLPMCDGDVNRLDGIRVFDRSLLELSEVNPTRKSALVVWGANHNFYNTEWTKSEGSHCLGHRALFTDGETGSAEQRQTAFFPALAFFSAAVLPQPDLTIGHLFDSQSSSLADPRTDRAQIPASNSQFSLPLEDFSGPTGTSSRGFKNAARSVTVNQLSAPGSLGAVINDQSLRVATISWTSAGASTYFQNNWAASGAGLDLSGFERLEFRVDRLKHSSNVDATTNFSVQLANADGSFSNKLPINAYTTLDGPVGAILATGVSRTRPWLPTASISLSAFSGAKLKSIQGVRLMFDSTSTGLIRVASVRASRAVPASSPATAMVASALAPRVSSAEGSTAATEEMPASEQPGADSDAIRHSSNNTIDSLRPRASDASTLTLALRTANPFAARDEYPLLLVGGAVVSASSVHPGGDLSKIEFAIARTTFDQLADAAEVTVQYGRGAADEIWDFGPLLKAALTP